MALLFKQSFTHVKDWKLLKKTTFYQERDEKKREEYLENIEKVPKDKRIYIDESGINKYVFRPFARAKIGKIIIEAVSGKRYQRESFIARKVESKILAPFCYQGTCNTDLFNYWLENILLPELTPGFTLIMDNATFHKSQKTQELIKKSGCEVLFLPSYSPDLNPIEIFWANFKKLVQQKLTTLKNLSKAIDESFLACANLWNFKFKAL